MADVVRRQRGVGHGHMRVGGVAGGSGRRVRGCGGWRFRDAGTGTRRRCVGGRIAVCMAWAVLGPEPADLGVEVGLGVVRVCSCRSWPAWMR